MYQPIANWRRNFSVNVYVCQREYQRSCLVMTSKTSEQLSMMTHISRLSIYKRIAFLFFFCLFYLLRWNGMKPIAANVCQSCCKIQSINVSILSMTMVTICFDMSICVKASVPNSGLLPLAKWSNL